LLPAPTVVEAWVWAEHSVHCVHVHYICTADKTAEGISTKLAR